MYLDRLQSQEELAFHLERLMQDKAKITGPEFLKLTEEVFSIVFLCVSSSCRHNGQIDFHAHTHKVQCVQGVFVPAGAQVQDGPESQAL